MTPTIAETAISMLNAIERGEPFVFEAQEGDFLIFRCDDGTLGMMSVDDAAKLTKSDSGDDAPAMG